ncbi:MAG: YtxH domain-containing protein [Oscillospiraceae bacterium]|nr:YtxH domain-containing protein [Oscillospiraceae bacterium]MBQ2634614.1 YtxH domain-containing protein [Oscillospiraceae bacterium]MBR3084492.1 YtxH domain-containing protein [Oscillospiraceae bacterium]MBR3861967.1 YtxH domain-containing protein [Oscillospiraceae bacterium]MBR6095645.1 YtxH domain-containing protein [Oscillospiraceae bacterium]
MKFAKGMMAGLMVGAGLMLVLGPDKRSSKRQLNRALRSMKQAVEEAGSALGLGV